MSNDRSVDRSGSDTFPSIRSLLSPPALAQMLGDEYGLDGVRCRLIKATSRDVYHIDARDGPRVLIVYPYGHRTAAEITTELDLLDYLDSRGLPVAAAIPRLDGEPLTTLAAPEGDRSAALFRFVQGSNLSHGLGDAVAQRLGRLVADMHLLADEWQRSGAKSAVRPPINAQFLIDRTTTLVRPLVSNEPDTLIALTLIAAELREHLERLPTDGPGYAWVHGDVIPTNVLVGPGDALTLLDFDFCGPGWRVFDVATFLWASRDHRLGEAVDGAFLAGYEEVRPLADWERESLPLFLTLRSLFRLGNAAARVDVWGTSTLPGEVIQRQLAAIRTDLSQYLAQYRATTGASQEQSDPTHMS